MELFYSNLDDVHYTEYSPSHYYQLIINRKNVKVSWIERARTVWVQIGKEVRCWYNIDELGVFLKLKEIFKEAGSGD